MQNLNLPTWAVSLAQKAKAIALNVTEIELKVLEATNEDSWGPHGQVMAEIAKAAEEPEKYNLIMNVLSERLAMRDENWRLCYKALLLLEYLVKRGPWRVVDELQRSVSSLERLRDDFEYKDPQGRDQGINVRQRAGELAALVSNVDRVRAEREKASKNAGKYKGVSASDVRMGGFGNSGGYGGGDSDYSGSGGYGRGGFGNNASSGLPKPVDMVTRRSQNGGGGVAGAAAGPAAGSTGEEEDPFEATRRRIERLKAEGALAADGSQPSPGLLDPASQKDKAPKKLKDVKINPAVAATFASINITPASSTGSLGKLAAPMAPSSASNSAADLLSDLEVPPATSRSTAAQSDWDAFGSAGGAPPAQAVSAAASSSQQPVDLFGGLSSIAPPPLPARGLATSAATSSGGGAAAPAPVDLFSGLAAAPHSAHAAPSASSSVGGAAPLDLDLFSGLAAASVPAPPAPAMAPPRPAAVAPRPAAKAALDPFDFAEPSVPVPALAATPLPPAPKPAPVPAAAAPAPVFDPFGGFATAAPPASKPAAASQPLDPFFAMATSSAPRQPAASSGINLFAASPAPSPAFAPSSADPFAALASSGAAATGGKAALKGAEPPKSKDPFAGLGF